VPTSPAFNARVIGSLLLFALAAYWIIGQRATFTLGGDDNGGGDPVDARGYDAIAIGLVPLGLGIVNLAVGIRGRGRIPVFWWGAAALGAAFLYGLVQIVLRVRADFFSQPG
jgi:hypothetical protein